MRKPLLTTLALLVLLCAPCAAAPADEEAGEVPFTFEKGYVIVAGKIKGREPVEFIVSTGDTNSSVNLGVVERYKLTMYYTGVGRVTGFNDKTVSFATLPDVSVGPAAATSINARLSSTAEVSKLLGREIFGTLGYDFFRGRTVQLDFGKKVMRFLDKGAAGGERLGAGGALAGTAFLQNFVATFDFRGKAVVLERL
ncbi:MAG TPA: aspartyl protease family protein [Pyrinomonadaceae bacterium]|jgi:hypothetical protein